MKNDISKEQWINEVLNSTDGMKQAQPPVDLYEQIILKTQSPKTIKVNTLSVKYWTAAAMLLLALNIGSVVYSMEHSRKALKTTGTSQIAAELELQSTYNY